MVNPLRRPEQLKDKPAATTTPAGQYPGRVNLTNSDNVCYASAVIQVLSSVPGLRALVSDSGSLPFSDSTGRGDSVELNDPDLSKRRLFLKQLRDIHPLLEKAEERLPAERTLRLMITMRKINNRFKFGCEDDPSAFFSTIVDILNDAGDKSAPSPTLRGETTSPTHQALENARRRRIKAGGYILSLEEEVASYREAHLATGHDSPVTRLTNLELAKESVCSSKTCPNPYARSFHLLNILHLSFPVSEEGYTMDRSYSMEDLVGTWAREGHLKTCQHDGKEAKETVQKIVGTPEILVLQLNRLAHTATGARHLVSNPLIIDMTLDLHEHCERWLPTEKLCHERMKSLPTKYRLRALIRQRSGHVYTYALTPDTKGVLHWARFDDCREQVLWESPISSIPRNAGQKDDFMFFYERVEPKAEGSIAADKNSVGESVGGKEVGAGKPVAISSGKISASDGQKVGKQDHGPVGEGTKKNEPVAGKNPMFSALEMQKVGNLAGKIVKKQTGLVVDLKTASDDQKAAELERVADLKKVAELKRVTDLKKLLDIKKVVDDKKVADDRQKDDLIGTNKKRKKEKKTETDSAGNTFDAVMADHAAALIAKQKVDSKKVSDKQIASNISAYRIDYTALSNNVSRWTHKFPQLQARVRGLEAWLDRHHVSMRKRDLRVVWAV
jgi:hypothetical protein